MKDRTEVRARGAHRSLTVDVLLTTPALLRSLPGRAGAQIRVFSAGRPIDFALLSRIVAIRP